MRHLSPTTRHHLRSRILTKIAAIRHTEEARGGMYAMRLEGNLHYRRLRRIWLKLQPSHGEGTITPRPGHYITERMV